VASSADGSKLVAVVYNGQIYTSTAGSTTTVGVGGFVSGNQGAALELLYVGSNQFITTSQQGTLFAY